MGEIPVPVSSDDKSALKNLQANMNSISQKIQEKIKRQGEVIPLFKTQLDQESKQLKEVIREGYKDVKNPNLLEAEASIDEIKPFLKKVRSLRRGIINKLL